MYGKYLKSAGRGVSANIKWHQFIFVTPWKQISCHAVDAVNVSQRPPPLLLIDLSPLASRCCKTAHVRPQNFLELANLINAVWDGEPAENGRLGLLWAGTGPGPPWPDPLTGEVLQLHLQSVHCKITSEMTVFFVLCNRRVQQKHLSF